MLERTCWRFVIFVPQLYVVGFPGPSGRRSEQAGSQRERERTARARPRSDGGQARSDRGGAHHKDGVARSGSSFCSWVRPFLAWSRCASSSGPIRLLVPLNRGGSWPWVSVVRWELGRRVRAAISPGRVPARGHDRPGWREIGEAEADAAGTEVRSGSSWPHGDGSALAPRQTEWSLLHPSAVVRGPETPNAFWWSHQPSILGLQTVHARYRRLVRASR
jgi:hypothetical protein